MLIPLEETYRNLAALLLVTWAILDSIRGGVPAGRQHPNSS
ncbi:hypothetical protein [Deinococcus aquaticus]|uniref:Transposase n=1 Tax=Deinococcus aquaticus TaxID=328692 RepID=A0ABY7UYG9_9DEIO|nr:hypothetical protein [Deinococcus aquaticus]WDA57964.1 hypothetical protein M8445_11455 [Deinococcus aquaticus]